MILVYLKLLIFHPRILIQKKLSMISNHLGRQQRMIFLEERNTTIRLAQSNILLCEVQLHNIEFSDKTNIVSRPTYFGTLQKAFECSYCQRKLSSKYCLTAHM